MVNNFYKDDTMVYSYFGKANKIFIALRQLQWDA